jgi:hypothetical protein
MIPLLIRRVRNRFSECRTKDLDETFDEAKQKNEEEYVYEDPTDLERELCLKRQWFLVHRNTEYRNLESVIPSGLNGDLNKWFYGVISEAKHRYIIILNSSWSKTELRNRLTDEGLEDGIELFEPETRHAIEHDVIRMISD